ncbi:MAG: aerobic carbon-monoxide dehydrogenase medium subunit [Solirubrobacterales bacterium]|nr:aerobic carbon-monoxide dehydrogenase medium subunit [Solirubrobacterales bacterium]
MKPAPFEYVRPATVAEAVAALAEHGGMARVLAGGQSLVPMLGMRLMRPTAVIDINGLEEELGAIDARGAETTIGALVRYREIEGSPVISERLPLLQSAVRYIGDRQVRNRGTLGGAVAQSDPTGEMPLVCLTLGARVLACGADGERTVPIEDFFIGSYANALDPEELIVGVRFGVVPERCTFFERGRKHNDFALLSFAVAATPGLEGRWSGVRIGLGGMNDTPVLAAAAASRLEGSHWDEEAVAEAAGLALEEADPPDDVRASAEYRAHLLPIHLRRVLTEMAGGPNRG